MARIDDNIRSAAIAMYIEGYSSKAVAEKFKISYKSVLAWVKLAGHSVKPPIKYKKLSPEKVQEVLDAYDTGKHTLKSLSKLFGQSFKVIKTCIYSNDKKIGIVESNKRRALSIADRTSNMIYRVYKKNAASRKLEFTLTILDIENLIFSKCFYCSRIGVNKSISLRYNGIDRKDNTIGYLVENCVTCCGQCNRAKSDLTISQFYDWINMVHEGIKN